jgi:hypothetical protein
MIENKKSFDSFDIFTKKIMMQEKLTAIFICKLFIGDIEKPTIYCNSRRK